MGEQHAEYRSFWFEIETTGMQQVVQVAPWRAGLGIAPLRCEARLGLSSFACRAACTYHSTIGLLRKDGSIALGLL